MCDGNRNCCQKCTCCKCKELRRAYLKIDSRCGTENDNELDAQAYTCGENCKCCTCKKIAKDYIAEEKCMKKKRDTQKSREDPSASTEFEVEIREKKLYSGKPKIDINITDSSDKLPAAVPKLERQVDTPKHVDMLKDDIGPVKVTETATKTSAPRPIEESKKTGRVTIQETPTGKSRITEEPKIIPSSVAVAETKTGSPKQPGEPKITPGAITGPSSGKPRPTEEPSSTPSPVVENETERPRPVEEPKTKPVPVAVTATSSEKPRPVEEPKTKPVPVAVTATSSEKPRPVEEPITKPVPVAVTATSSEKPRPVEEPITKPVPVAVTATSSEKTRPVEEPKITPVPVAVTATSSEKPRPIEEPKTKPVPVTVTATSSEKPRSVEDPKITPVPVAVIATSSEKLRPVEEPKTKPPEEPKITPVPVPDTVSSSSKPRSVEETKKIPVPIPVTETHTEKSVPRTEITTGKEKQIEEQNLRQSPILATEVQTGRSREPENSKITPVPVTVAGNRLNVGKPEISEKPLKPEEGVAFSVTIPIVAVVQKTGGPKEHSRDEDKPSKCPPTCNCCKDKKQNADSETQPQNMTKKDFPQMDSVKPQQSAKTLAITSSEEDRSRRSLTRKIERPHSEKDERVRIEAMPPPSNEESRKEQRVCVCTKSFPIKEDQMKKDVPQIEMVKPQIEAVKSQQSAKIHVPSTDEDGGKWNVTRRIERPHSEDKVRRGQTQDSSEYDEKSNKGGLTRKFERPEKEESVHRTEAIPIPVSEYPAKVQGVCSCKPPPVMEDRTKKDVPQMEVVKPQQTAKEFAPSTSDEDRGKWNVTRRIERPHSEDKVRRGQTQDSSEYDEKSNKGGLTRKFERPEKEERVHRTEAIPIPVSEYPAKVQGVCSCKPPPVMEDRTKKDVPQMEVVKPQQTAKEFAPSTSDEDRGKWNVTRRIERPHSEDKVRRGQTQDSSEYDEKSKKGGLTRKFERPEKEERVHRTEAIPIPVSEYPVKVQGVCSCKPAPVMEDRTKKDVPQMEVVKPQQTAKEFAPSTSDEDRGKWNVTRRIERPHSEDKVRRGQTQDSSEYDEKSNKGGLTRKFERPEKEERVHRTEAIPIPVSEYPAKVQGVCSCKPPPVMEDRTKKDVPQMEVVKPQQTAKEFAPSTSDEDRGKWNVTRRIERPHSEDKVRRGQTQDSSEYDEKSNKGGLTRKFERPEKEERVHRTEAIPIPVSEYPAKVQGVCSCKLPPVMEDRTKKDVPQMEVVKPQQTAKEFAPSTSDEDRGKWNVTRRIERPHSEDKVRRGQTQDSSEYDEKSSKGGLTRKFERPENEERVHRTEAIPIPVSEFPAKVQGVCSCKPPPVMEDRTKKDVPQMEVVKPQQTAKEFAPSTSDEDRGKWNVTRRIERPHSEDKVRRGQTQDSSEYDEKSNKGGLTRKFERPEKEERVHRTEAIPIPVSEYPAKVQGVCSCKPPPVMEDRTKKDVPQMEVVKPQQTAKEFAPSTSDEDRGKWNVTRRIERPHSEDKVRRGQTQDSSEYDEKSNKGGLTRKFERPENEERVHRTEAIPIPVSEFPAKVQGVCSCKPPPVMEDRTKKDVPQMEVVKPQQTAKEFAPSTSDEDRGKWNVTRRIERPHSEDKVRRGQTQDSSEYDEKSSKGGLTRKFERPENEERVHRTEAIPIPVSEFPAKVQGVCSCKPPPVMEDRTKKDVPQMEVVKPQQTAKEFAPSTSDEDRGKWNVTRRIERPHSEDKVRRGQTQDSSEYDEKSNKGGLTRKFERPEKEERVHRTEAIPIPVSEYPAKVQGVCSCKPPPVMEDRTKKDVPQMEVVKPQQTAKEFAPSTSDEDRGKWNVTRRIERPHSEDKVRRGQTQDSSEYDEKSNKGGLTRKFERPEKEERVHRTEAIPIPVSEYPAKVQGVCSCKPPPVMEDRTKKDVPQMEVVKPQQTAKEFAPSTSDEDRGKWNVTRRIERPHSEDKVRRGQTQDSSEYDEKSNKGGLTRKFERPEKEERVHRTEAIPIPVSEYPAKVQGVCSCKPPPVMEDRTKKDVPQMEVVKPQQTAKEFAPSTSDEDRGKWNVTRRIERPHSEDKVRRGQTQDSSEYVEKSNKGGLTRKLERPEKEERSERKERVYQIEAIPSPPDVKPARTLGYCNCKMPTALIEDRTQMEIPQIETIKPIKSSKMPLSYDEDEEQDNKKLTRKIPRPTDERFVEMNGNDSLLTYDRRATSLTRGLERPTKSPVSHGDISSRTYTSPVAKDKKKQATRLSMFQKFKQMFSSKKSEKPYVCEGGADCRCCK